MPARAIWVDAPRRAEARPAVCRSAPPAWLKGAGLGAAGKGVWRARRVFEATLRDARALSYPTSPPTTSPSNPNLPHTNSAASASAWEPEGSSGMWDQAYVPGVSAVESGGRTYQPGQGPNTWKKVNADETAPVEVAEDDDAADETTHHRKLLDLEPVGSSGMWDQAFIPGVSALNINGELYQPTGARKSEPTGRKLLQQAAPAPASAPNTVWVDGAEYARVG